MSKIYSASEMQKWDQYTISHTPIASIELMERAAIKCTKQLLGNHRFQTISIVCGKGNNGGDGLAIARILASCEKEVTVYICDYSLAESTDFTENLKRLPSTVKFVRLNEKSPVSFKADLIIDAIFGTGLTRPVEGWLGLILSSMNASGTPIISIDIPSGLFATENQNNPLQNCIRAAETLTFQQTKMVFLHAEYAVYTGKVKVLDIGLSPFFTGKEEALLIGAGDCELESSNVFAHKGTKGYLSIIAGNSTMLGAAILAAKAGFKTGAGYVGVMGPEELISPLAVHLPEAIWMGEKWSSLSKKTTALAIGPGIGKSAKALSILTSALKANLPVVIDADALNLISENPSLWKEIPKNTILTPHFKELTRLIGRTNSPEECLARQQAFSVYSSKRSIFQTDLSRWQYLC